MIFGKLLGQAAPPPPSAPAPVTAATPILANAPEGPRATVLVVDDSSMLRTAITQTLKKNQFAVIAADSGEKGLDAWEKNKSEIKIVLSDVFMPGMDGLTFARTLRGRHRTLPIILMSSKLDDDSRWIAEEAGFRLLPKPFKDELLIELKG